MAKPLSMAGIFRILERIGHRPQAGLNAKIKFKEDVSHVVKRVD